MEVQTPDSLIGGGDHFGKVPVSMHRDRTSASAELTLPQTKLCKHVEDMTWFVLLVIGGIKSIVNSLFHYTVVL